MARYQIREDSGASEIIEASTLDEALERACAWASGGHYDERVSVRVYVDEIDEDGDQIPGEHATATVDAGPEPEEPECEDGKDHDWQSPEWLGGCRENPGVWSTVGTSFRFEWVCARCGAYKIVLSAGAQRNPGQLEEETQYAPADERSRAWIEEAVGQIRCY